ncbi:MAG: DUF4124 domain-containing protein [Deltaproteobacteria bacterium]|nr:DUF4124 domain-containing protein [Deltaproteobacteria bacterium]
MKKQSLLLIGFFLVAFTLLNCNSAFSAVYKWTDEKGVLHFTDNFENVPDKYRFDLEKTFKEEQEETEDIKTTPTKPVPSTRAPRKYTPRHVPAQKQGSPIELYDGHQLIWWTQKINDRRRTFESAEKKYDEMVDYINGVDYRWDLWQQSEVNKGKPMLTSAEVKKYNGYKEGLAKQKNLVTSHEKALNKILRDARMAGVPKKIREVEEDKDKEE